MRFPTSPERPKSEHRKSELSTQALQAFTLVELLVVIGIIGVLISLLLPSLNKARQQAKSVQCTSNLKQIGLGILMYCNDNHGHLMPAVRYNAVGGIETNNGTIPSASTQEWPSFLVDGNYVATPVTFGSGPYSAEIASADYSKSVFHCPEGLQPEDVPSRNKPYAKWDPAGAAPTGCEDSQAGSSNAYFETWYSCNGADFAGTFGIWPFNCTPISGTGGGTTTPDDRTMQLSALNPSSAYVLIYDGTYYYHECDDSGANPAGARINARHNNWTMCNVLFADGHVDGLTLSQLPGGAANTVNELGASKSAALLDARNPSVHWRTDQ
jgi:prepilin-type processing-associated H-X9-DG protein/prepilin-type N-terminal cleavage/methylation domain-containing protein